MSAWQPIETIPEYGYIVTGWWIQLPGCAPGWEICDDHPECATHWCRLPEPPEQQP